MLNIAIVNDTAIAVEALYRTIVASPDYCLLWIATTGVEAVKHCAIQPPDLILMDLNMPELDGVEATRQIMQRSPCAILIVTASITQNETKVFEAMGHGALDVVRTPAIGSGNPQAIQILLDKIAGVVKVSNSLTQLKNSWLKKPSPNSFRTHMDHPSHPSYPSQFSSTFNSVSSSPVFSPASSRTSFSSALPPLIVMGTSTGGPNALQHILSRLPVALKATIVVIQHIDAQFASGLVDWLNQTSQLPVALARNGDCLEPGRVLVAGTNDHLILRPNHTLRYVHEPADLPYRPSVDVFFQSVAHHWAQPGLAVLLTGMGRDGAKGMAQLHAANWHTIAESAESCVVFGMAKAAIDLGAAKQVLPLEKIVPSIVSALPANALPLSGSDC
ncbi:MAG: chemotaxis-specific protein-glutamate methyltransferase CheB [Cyanobacteria bacterium J06621_11]